jgi:DNA modification methylase
MTDVVCLNTSYCLEACSGACATEDAYAAFLAGKHRVWSGQGVAVDAQDGPGWLYPFQWRLTRWALRKGRAGLFADTGLGKTRMQLAWAAQVPGRVLILAPLCVGAQTIREGHRVGVSVAPVNVGERIEITNYERLHHVRVADYDAVILDESSILKSYDGKTRTRLIEAFRDTPYRLCCTATPAPNDTAELANHCEFLGVMTRAEMLATFFVHDEDGWRLKGHAQQAFYRWLASWGMFLRRPSDVGESDGGYLLPPLVIQDRIVGDVGPTGEYLFPGLGLGGVGGRATERRRSVADRVAATVELVTTTPGAWIVWCGLNDEQDAIARALGADCVSVQGKDSEAEKERRLLAFLDGTARVLVTKPSVAGFGLNLQHCHQMAFVGLGDSYETYYQAIRRCYRFGQQQPVTVHVVVSPAETEIVANVRRKEVEAAAVGAGLHDAMRTHELEELGVTEREREAIGGRVVAGEGWTMEEGDCVERLRALKAETVDFSVYSPPFISLYTYTNSERDIGNCATREEFLAHYAYVVRELLRTTKPGRLSAVHIAQTTTTKATHGVIGLTDLRGAVIDLHVREGWVYHGEVCIDKDPQAQAIRTHAKALLFVQLRKDASWLRPALADYILVFKKPGENAEPIHPDITNEDWIEWARPIWYGIRESDTLNVREARADDDDRHICPLQLGTIERCIRLWSNPGELVVSPFAGIGSEGYESLRRGRRFHGMELKPEYFDAAVKNLRRAETTAGMQLPLVP